MPPFHIDSHMTVPHELVRLEECRVIDVYMLDYRGFAPAHIVQLYPLYIKRVYGEQNLIYMS